MTSIIHYTNSLLGNLAGYPIVWIFFYFCVLIPLGAISISKDYFKFKHSNNRNEEKLFRRLAIEVWGFISLSIVLLYVFLKILFKDI